MMPSLRKSRSAAAVSLPTCSCASLVDAAMCGVAMTCGSPIEAPVLRRLRVEDVEPGTGDVPLFDGIGQGRLVDQLAARRIDNADALLALREPLSIKEVLRRGQRRHVERDVIGPRAQIIERHKLRPRASPTFLPR